MFNERVYTYVIGTVQSLYNAVLGVDRVISELCYKGKILQRGSYMSAHVLLNLLNELGKRDKCKAYRVFYLFFATSLKIQ